MVGTADDMATYNRVADNTLLKIALLTIDIELMV